MMAVMSVFRNTFHGSLLAAHCCLYALSSDEAEIPVSGARAMSASLRHVEGKGVGYNEGYTTLEMFLTRNRCQHSWVPFVDIRGHLFNDGRYAANAGLGLRYRGSALVWGINGYCDYRTTRAFHYNQLGVGLEAIGSFWSVQLNTYFPLGRTHSSAYDISYQKDAGSPQFWGFRGNRLLVQLPEGAAYNLKKENAFQGIDASFSMRPFTKGPFSLGWGLGPYYFRSAQGRNTALGGRFNVDLGITEYFGFHVTATYDTLFHQGMQAGCRMTMPFGRKNTGKFCTPLPSEPASFYVERLARGADRGEIIVVDTKSVRTRVSTEEAVHPHTGQPYHFLFCE